MDSHVLEGLVVATPWGRRTIRIIDATITAVDSQTINYSFEEDSAVRYRLMVAPDLLVTHPAEVRALVGDWTSAGHPNGSDQPLTRDAVVSARQPSVLSPPGETRTSP